MNFKVYMKAFLFDPTLMNDLVYCQKSLFTTIKIHQDLVDEHLHQGAGPSPANYNQVRTMLDELEEVIESINRDQQKVTHILRSELKGFYDLIHNTVLEVVDIDINAAHEYISQTIQDHFNYNYDVDIKPMHISERLTEQELEEKFVIPLRAPTVVSKQKIQLSLLKPKQERVILPKPVKIQPKAPRKTLHIQNELISPPIPVVEKKIKIQEAKVVKETRHEEVKVSIEDKREEEVPPTTSISNSRMNLLKALTKAKTTFTTPATMEFLEEYPEWPSSPEPDCEDNEEPEDLYEPPQAEPVRKRLGRPKKRSNSSSSSGKSPVVNDEGSSDSWKEKFPPIDPLQDEDIEMEMDDYDQGGFLRIFGLITPEQREILKQRRNERKKRKVTRKNNEKKDFFYGNIDIYESERQYRRMTNRKPQLYSPQPQLIKPQLIKPQLIKPQLLKKEDPLAQNVKAAKRKASSEASGIRKCNTCTKADKIKMLSVCLQCTEFYHLTCHNSSYDLDLDDELKTSCPACFG